MRNLTSREKEVLQNHLPSYQERRIKLLLQLDVEFGFNRLALSRYLISQGLMGYSTRSIERIIGKPVLLKSEYRILKEIFIKRKLDLTFLQLLISKRIYRKLLELQDGHPYPYFLE